MVPLGGPGLSPPRRAAGARVAGWATAALAVAAPANAHLVSTGLGPFYDGLGHLAVTPEDVLAVVAVGLLAGLRGKEHGRAAMLVLPTAWLAGGWLGVALVPPAAPAVAVSSLLVLGVLVAVDRHWPRPATVALAAIVGLAHGYLGGGALAASPGGGLGVLGSVTGVFLLVTGCAAAVVGQQAPWTRIAVRVAGSWIAAVGLLMLGWWWRGALT